ncbi:MAG: cysteine hydrolase [Candidatus Thermoplasmatota archaeon]|nr:cysteine hydrolase [Candidatus Thermoplasmatota archaeon]
MSFDSQVDISSILNQDSCLLINLNYYDDLFKKSFSKMEFIMAMDYLEPKVKKMGISSMDIDTTDAMQHTGSKGIKKENYESVKAERRDRLIPRTSDMDMQFIARFSKEFAFKNKVVKSRYTDIMLDENIRDAVESYSPGTLVFTGFRTDLEILTSAMTAELMGYYSVVVSDATSTYSERLFFSSLELMSQNIEVIDTRDLMKIWGYDQ